MGLGNVSLEGIQVGDKVLYDSYPREGRYDEATVTRVTKTQVSIDKTENKFAVKNGDEIGHSRGAWGGTPYIQPMTDENRQKYRDYIDKTNKERRWYAIKQLPTPMHVSWERLKEIYAELEPPK